MKEFTEEEKREHELQWEPQYWQNKLAVEMAKLHKMNNETWREINDAS